tara:strand:- start:610 stop:867 length:258 start_codon:yes stop_codon:yes gene_type:complete
LILNIIISVFIFFILLYLNFLGAVGRIERKNQVSGKFQDLGPVSDAEEIAFIEGTHKKLAIKQSIKGALIWSVLVFCFLIFWRNR